MIVGLSGHAFYMLSLFLRSIQLSLNRRNLLPLFISNASIDLLRQQDWLALSLTINYHFLSLLQLLVFR